MKITVYLPEPPEGYEVIHLLERGECDGVLFEGQWVMVKSNQAGFVLRKKQPTLADWANDQPAFVALAEILVNACIFFNGSEWILSVGSSTYGTKLPPPPNDLRLNPLELSNGKLIDTP